MLLPNPEVPLGKKKALLIGTSTRNFLILGIGSTAHLLPLLLLLLGHYVITQMKGIPTLVAPLPSPVP